MAAWASASLPISTKPKPLERPVSRSMMTCADATVPCGSKVRCKSLSVNEYGRLPTYNFLPMRASTKETPEPGIAPRVGLRGSAKHAGVNWEGRVNGEDGH